MSVQSEIERISNNIEETYDVLEESGAEVPEVRNSDNLPETVRVATTPVNPDWSQSDSTQKDYIKNRTHYEERVTISWNGDETGYEVYYTAQSEYVYRNFVRVLDDVPASKEDLSIFGLCKFSHDSNVYSSDVPIETGGGIYDVGVKYNSGKFSSSVSEDHRLYNYYTAETIEIHYRDHDDLYNTLRVLFVLSEGTVGEYYIDGVRQLLQLPKGVYFIVDKIYSYTNPTKTIEYSFVRNVRVSNSYLSKSVVNYSKALESNTVIFSYSVAEGHNNYIGSFACGGEYIFNNAYNEIDLDFYGYVTSKIASHVEGGSNWVLCEYSHGEGYNNKLRVPKSHIEGSNNVLGNIDDSSISGGDEGCHVEGVDNRGYGSTGVHVEGTENSGYGKGCHVEGWKNKANGDATHVQNVENSATACGASASGRKCVASADYADAGGYSTEASHRESFTRGRGTKSGRARQAVFGEYNKVYDDSLFDVGNGSSNTDRKTAFSVKEDGSARVQLQGETEDSITRKDYVDNAIKSGVDEAVKNILNIAERVDSWETVQKIVRAGYAPFIFKVGDQFVCNHSEFGELTWDIIGFNHDEPTDSNYKYSMTLQLHDILDTTYREFDGREALFCASEEINPGNYCISYNNKVDGSGTTYYLKFTIPEGVVVPVGGLFVNLATSGNTYTILQDCFSTDNPLGTFTTTSSSSVPDGYTLLGECNYYRAYNITSASNFYKESGIRFYLNGNSSNSIDWVPQHSCDMPPSYVNSSGFMYGLDEDFKNVLGKVRKKTYDVVSDSVFCTDDFIFLPSRSEVYGGDNISVSDCVVDEGLPYEYYINNSGLEECGISKDSNRIKYGSDDVAYRYYLRSLSLTSSTSGINSTVLFRIGCVSATGNITMVMCRSTSDSSEGYLVPCCCIV